MTDPGGGTAVQSRPKNRKEETGVFRISPFQKEIKWFIICHTGGYMDLKTTIRDVVDFPKKGIIFKDISTLLLNPEAFRAVLDQMEKKYLGKKIDKVVAVESRGFIFGGALADRLRCGIVLARKEGKLPAATICQSYELEYGTSTLEIHTDAIGKNERVIIVDDLLATGGTAAAVAAMVEKLGGRTEGIEFLIELDFLEGREKLHPHPVHAVINYP